MHKRQLQNRVDAACSPPAFEYQARFKDYGTPNLGRERRDHGRRRQYGGITCNTAATVSEPCESHGAGNDYWTDVSATDNGVASFFSGLGVPVLPSGAGSPPAIVSGGTVTECVPFGLVDPTVSTCVSAKFGNASGIELSRGQKGRIDGSPRHAAKRPFGLRAIKMGWVRVATDSYPEWRTSRCRRPGATQRSTCSACVIVRLSERILHPPERIRVPDDGDGHLFGSGGCSSDHRGHRRRRCPHERRGHQLDVGAVHCQPQSGTDGNGTRRVLIAARTTDLDPFVSKGVTNIQAGRAADQGLIANVVLQHYARTTGDNPLGQITVTLRPLNPNATEVINNGADCGSGSLQSQFANDCPGKFKLKTGTGGCSTAAPFDCVTALSMARTTRPAQGRV